MYCNDTQKPQGNQIISLNRLEDIGEIPISLSEAKLQLRVTFDDDDTEITALISKAVRFVENYCNISITAQRIELIAVLTEDYSLPYGPVVGIESVQDNKGTPGSGPLSWETATTSWQTVGDLFMANSWYRQRIVYTTGRGTIQPDLKDVCFEVLTFLYENRGRNTTDIDLMPILTKAQNYQNKSWI